MNDLRRGERGERLHVLITQRLGQRRGDGFIDVLVGVEASHEDHEFARLQKDQAPIAVVIGQRTEGLIAQRHLLTETPGRRRVKDSRTRERHDLVDPAESVDRHLFDEQLFDVADFAVRFFLLQCFARHVFSLVWNKSNVP